MYNRHPDDQQSQQGHPQQQQGHPQQPYPPASNGQPINYAPPPGSQPPSQLPINPNRPEMAAIHPQQYQQPYPDHNMPRLPAPGQQPMHLPQQQYYQQPPRGYPQQAPQQQPQPSNQAAPRQRTAIACKYCRRRKIRCSGFENAADGRCTNCVRFNQECVFTPVSAQTQAFVPAQAVYGRRGPQGGPPPQLYGPYGQPLPRGPEGYPPQYALPSPGHPPPPGQQPYYQAYPPQGYPPPQGFPPQQYEQGSAVSQPPTAGSRRRRASDEPHTPTLPPPNPGHSAHLAGHEQQQQPYMYADQSGYAASPAAPQQAYPAGPTQGYYPAQSQRTSPGSTYSYEQPRGSDSPHTQVPYYGHPPQQAHAAGGAPTQSGRTPPPPQDGRNGLAIRDMLSDNSERTAADSDMVSALNRTSRR